MKTPDLIQSRMFHKSEMTLEPDGISVSEKTLSSSKKTHIYYDNIPPKPQEITIAPKKMSVYATIVTIIAVICLPLAFTQGAKNGWQGSAFWGFIAALLWAGFFLSKKSLIRFVQNGSGINLYKSSPSETAVAEFIKKMFICRNAYLIKKHGQFLDIESFEDKMARLKYLRMQEAFTESEFQTRIEEITKGKKSGGPIGFAPE